MLEENFALIVAVVALLYSFGIRKLQYAFGNQKEMEALQKETKALNEEYKKAAKEKNETRMERLMKKQQETFPKMGKLMMGQFKVMGVVLLLFFGMMWTLNEFNPFKKDDVFIQLVDDGTGCDSVADDLVYSGCYKLSNDNYGPWVVVVDAYNGNPFAQNSTSFLYKEGSLELLYTEVKGEAMGVSTDKEEYLPGEVVKITATPGRKPEKIEAKLNMGTWFYVDLPFTIPLLNIQRINQPYWWFITVTILSGLIITPIYKKLQKQGDTNAVAKK